MTDPIKPDLSWPDPPRPDLLAAAYAQDRAEAAARKAEAKAAAKLSWHQWAGLAVMAAATIIVWNTLGGFYTLGAFGGLGLFVLLAFSGSIVNAITRKPRQ